MTQAQTQAQMQAQSSTWADACLAAQIIAVCPESTGAVLRAPPGLVRDGWIATLSDMLPSGTPMRKIPSHVQDSRLLGGLDLAATLSLGRKTIQRGILAEADGGLVTLPMAERLGADTAGRLCQVLDAGEIVLERDGLALRHATRFGVLALDEGIAADERTPASVCDRTAFWIDLTEVTPRDCASDDGGAGGTDARVAAGVADARAALGSVTVPDEVLEGVCQAAAVLGIGSIRAVLFTLTAARAIAALDGRTDVSAEDATAAGRLTLAPRATIVPMPPEPPPPPPPSPDQEPSEQEQEDGQARELADMVLAACQACLPPDLLAGLRTQAATRRAEAGRSGQRQRGMTRGRPAGVRIGDPRSGARLHVLETLRAAAPRQKLRPPAPPPAPQGIAVRREDFRVVRTRPRTQTTTLFLVDASGSTALHRLGEAKGAVEILLDECYVRRDQVALLAFRGKGAELLLPPTGSLVRAKRCLGALPGGGGTPLASGLDAVRLLAEGVRRRGRVPSIIVMTDGRANVGRDGAPGRARAEADALAAARLIRATGIATLLIDTSIRPAAPARTLAQEMGARCLALPHADAAALSRVARGAAQT